MCVLWGMWLYLHDYHLYERTSACDYRLYMTAINVNAVNDRLLLSIWAHLCDYHLYERTSACDY